MVGDGWTRLEGRVHWPTTVEPIGLHECRHTYASLIHAAGCSLEEIGDYLGHSSAYMTTVTGICSMVSAKAAAAKLDAYLAQIATG